ncbi:MAG: hypothetical protein AAF497_24500, partial [Planctomycetota bacterium]
MNRLFLRLIMLCAAVILGAFAVAHAQKGLTQPASATQPAGQTGSQAIPPADFANSDVYGTQQSGFTSVNHQTVNPIESAQPDPPPTYA